MGKEAQQIQQRLQFLNSEALKIAGAIEQLKELQKNEPTDQNITTENK